MQQVKHQKGIKKKYHIIKMHLSVYFGIKEIIKKKKEKQVMNCYC